MAVLQLLVAHYEVTIVVIGAALVGAVLRFRLRRGGEAGPSAASGSAGQVALSAVVASDMARRIRTGKEHRGVQLPSDL